MALFEVYETNTDGHAHFTTDEASALADALWLSEYFAMIGHEYAVRRIN